MVLPAFLLGFILTLTGVAGEFVVPPCDLHMFDSNVVNCLSDFNRSMETAGFQKGCHWPAATGIYNQLKLCVDDWAKQSWCRGQGFLVDDVFLRVHSTHFQQCGQVKDPPFFTLIMLIAPVIIATLLMPVVCVKLTTWDTEMPASVGL